MSFETPGTIDTNSHKLDLVADFTTWLLPNSLRELCEKVGTWDLKSSQDSGYCK